MCGILGGNLIKTLDDMKTGLVSMMHRGTDGNTIFSFKSGMRLSHNRLSTQDLSESANQPMVSDDGNYYLAFNGELWKSTFEKLFINKEENVEIRELLAQGQSGHLRGSIKEITVD